MAKDDNRPEVVCVSACLRGVKCRWHGKVVHSRAAERIVASFGPDVRVIEVCPEMLGGLPCPRPPVKRRRGRVFETCEDKAMRKDVTGREVTAEFTRGAEEVLAICQREGVRRVVFCKWSPSCDANGVCGKLLRANGIEILPTF